MSGRPRFQLVATMRDEGPFLLEWIAYHRTIGFDDVLICSNDCSDHSDALLDLLARRGVVTHVRCKPAPDEKPQFVAYDAAARRLHPRPEDWLMVLDADEFLNVHVGDGGVRDLVAAVPEATAYMVSWRVFGSSGHRRWSREPVIERFTRAAPGGHGVNDCFKTLFRRADCYRCMLLPHGPGFARTKAVGELRPVDAAGEALDERYARAEEFLQISPAVHALAQINHYNTRSWDDYLVKHRRTGGIDAWERDPNWQIFDRNEEEDRSIQRQLPAVREVIARWLDDPKIARAQRRCWDAYDAHVRALREDAERPAQVA